MSITLPQLQGQISCANDLLAQRLKTCVLLVANHNGHASAASASPVIPRDTRDHLASVRCKDDSFCHDELVCCPDGTCIHDLQLCGENLLKVLVMTIAPDRLSTIDSRDCRLKASMAAKYACGQLRTILMYAHSFCLQPY